MRNYETIDHRRILNRTDRHPLRECLSGSEIAQRTLRGMAHGLAGPLDPDRIDALRMLGNGVVPLAGAHAIRTLGVALARRYGADPARFVRGVA